MKIIAPLLILFCVAVCAHAQVVGYQAPAEALAADRYQVKINGKDIFTYKNEVSSIAYFSFLGQIEVEITTLPDLKWVDIRPKNLNISPTFAGHTIKFSLDKPCNLSIELNGESIQPLYLFTSPLEVNAPTAATDKIKYFEGGKIHNVGQITLKSDETIYIAGGAIVQGTVYAADANNIKIMGRGILDGKLVNDQMVVLDRCDNALIEGIIIQDSKTWTVVPKWCNNLTINNLKEVCWRTGTDGLDLCGSSHVKVQNCFFRNNDDNIVLKCWAVSEGKYAVKTAEKGPDMTDIEVSNCVFWNMPWGNAIEIGFELKCDKISGIVFKNIDIIHTERGAVLSIHNGDFATVENIRFENIRVEDAMHKLIDIAIFRSQYSIDRPATDADRKAQYMQGAWDGVSMIPKGQESHHAKFRGQVKNIVFKNISVVDSQFPFSIISGYDSSHAVENITIDNLTIHGKRIKSAKEGRFFIENAKGIVFK